MSKYLNKLIVSNSTRESVNGEYTRNIGGLTPFVSANGNVISFDGHDGGWILEDKQTNEKLYIINNSFTKIELYHKMPTEFDSDGQPIDSNEDYTTTTTFRVFWA